MKTYSRLRAVIDLDAIRHNMQAMRESLRPETKIIAVIKTDAYGHGAIPIAEELEKMEYVWGYAVALIEEGELLRKSGVKKPIICLGTVFDEQIEEAIESEIRMTVSSYERAERISSKAHRLGKSAFLHIKIDTGMSRIGFPVCEESVAQIRKISQLPGIRMEGMYTHYSKADEREKAATRKQKDAYLWIKAQLTEAGVRFDYYHASNSAGIIDLPDSNMDLVRAGIAIYGLYPSEEVCKENVILRPAMELKAHVTFVKWIEKGTPVSYGGTFVAPEKMKVATIPAGYGDGYPRSLSGTGYVLIHGKKAPILGRVCMDQFMVDVTAIDEVEFGTPVTLVGKDGDEFLSIQELSNLADRFNYEFICDINKRVPREYISGGKVVKQVDYF